MSSMNEFEFEITAFFSLIDDLACFRFPGLGGRTEDFVDYLLTETGFFTGLERTSLLYFLSVCFLT